MIREIIENFLPWILYFALADERPEQICFALIVAISVSVICDFKGLKKGLIISWGSLIFFIAIYISIAVFHNQFIKQYMWLLANSALASIAWISLIIGKPFTLQYSKQTVAPDKWTHPIFIRINNIVTSTWGVIFLLGMLLDALRVQYSSLHTFSYELITYVPTICGIIFSAWFPDWYKTKKIAY